MITPTIRVLIADDRFVIREGLKWLLSRDPDILCVGEVERGSEIMAAIGQLLPDVLLLDVSMPDFRDPIGCVKQVRELYPAVKVLVLTGYTDRAMIHAMLTAGPAGYLVKDHMTTMLIQAIHQVARGETFYSPEVVEVLAWKSAVEHIQEESRELNPPEIEVLRLIGKGLSNAEIASQLNVSQYDVRSHISRIYSKLGTSSRDKVMRYAIEHHALLEGN